MGGSRTALNNASILMILAMAGTILFFLKRLFKQKKVKNIQSALKVKMPAHRKIVAVQADTHTLSQLLIIQKQKMIKIYVNGWG